MEPFVHFYTNSEHPDGEGSIDWILDNDEVIREDGSDYAFIVSKLNFDYGWFYSILEREEYLAIKPHNVLMYNDAYYVEK